MSSHITEQDIFAVYRACHNRDPEPDAVRVWLEAGIDLYTMIKEAVDSAEFESRMRTKFGAAPSSFPDLPEFVLNSAWRYSTPQVLRVTDTPLDRVLLVGQCLIDTWPDVLARLGLNVNMDRLLLRFEPPKEPPYPFDRYSFQISHIALREVLHDVDYFSWVRSGFSDLTEAERIFQHALKKLRFMIEHATVWSNHFPVFVTNLWRPQHSLNGRILRTYDLRDNLFFVDELNRHLAGMLSERKNVYLLDIDNISAVVGRRTVQDDMVVGSNHGSILADSMYDEDLKRLIKPRPPTEHFVINESDFIGSVWLEAEAMYRTLRQIDAVKMVCVDLDDTLWRGVLSEQDEVDQAVAGEGWPLGVGEALLALKRRGMILAIISKNTESRIREIFPKVFHGKLSLDDFAIIKINWNPKAENIREAMKDANLLPRSVVFVDDNPVERAAVQAAFPELRVIEASHYYWKRILLWSAETQVATASAESSRRTELIRAQVERETLRDTMSREEFLASLGVRLRMFRLRPDSKSFDRSFELLNKTNQFNTTGRRWSRQDFERACRDGMVVACDVSDRLTDYGLVLVAVVHGDEIEQVVMSCRVISLDVELAAMSFLAKHLLRQYDTITARMEETNANLLSRDLFSRAGWSELNGTWQSQSSRGAPAHITVLDEIASTPAATAA